MIELDLSNAAPFLAAALVTGGEITVPGWPASTTQAGDELRGLFVRMGPRRHGRGLALSYAAPARSPRSMPTCPSVTVLATAIAALAALADGPRGGLDSRTPAATRPTASPP